MNGDRFIVGEPDRAIVEVDALAPEKKLGSARFEAVSVIIENAAQYRLHRLIDEQRRHRNVILKKPRIKRLQRWRREQLIAKAQHDSIVFPRVLVAKFGDAPRVDRMSDGVEGGAEVFKRAMQRAFLVARRIHRCQFRSRIIRPQIVVGNREPSTVAAQQVVTAAAPEIRHGIETA